MAGDIIRAGTPRAAVPCAPLGAAPLLLGAAWLALCGCHGGAAAPPPSASPKAQSSAPVVAKKGPTAEQLTAGMVEAVVQGKAGPPLKLKFELAQAPKVGQPLEIDLAFMPQSAGSLLAMQIAAADGIDLGPGNGAFEVPGVEAGEVYRHTVRVTPTTEGVLILALSISLKREEVVDSAGFSIPIIAYR